MKTFNVIGTARLNGSLKLRWANSDQRLASLKCEGHTDITLISLIDASLNKVDCVRLMKYNEHFQSEEQQQLFDEYLANHDY